MMYRPVLPTVPCRALFCDFPCRSVLWLAMMLCGMPCYAMPYRVMLYCAVLYPRYARVDVCRRMLRCVVIF